MKPDIRKAGLLLIRDDSMLLCRKRRGSPLLILPGGKLESGETFLQALERELTEELGNVRLLHAEYIGSYTDRAAGNPKRNVFIELYRGELEGRMVPQSEIGELIWFGEHDDQAQLAPSLANRILPDLLARGILSWHAKTR